MTPKQEAFVLEYLIDLNATQAAIRAGYSEKTAKEQGGRLLTNVAVAAAIQEAQARRAERTEITADRVLQELGRIGFSDLRGLFTKDGGLMAVQDWPDDVAAAVASVEVVTKMLPGEADEELDAQPHGGALARKRNAKVEYVHKIKLWDKNSALEKIAKHLGMLKDKVDVNHGVQDSLAELMRAVDGRTRGLPTGD